jgi:hypothetical protein
MSVWAKGLKTVESKGSSGVDMPKNKKSADVTSSRLYSNKNSTEFSVYQRAHSISI